MDMLRQRNETTVYNGHDKPAIDEIWNRQTKRKSRDAKTTIKKI